MLPRARARFFLAFKLNPDSPLFPITWKIFAFILCSFFEADLSKSLSFQALPGEKMRLRSISSSSLVFLNFRALPRAPQGEHTL